jgi:two-component system chemotaxis response regulator CheY
MARGTVMLVDSFDERRMYADYLRAHDLHVYDIVRPEEALERLDVAAPDVVVTDLNFRLSVIDGPSFIRRIRERLGESPAIIVVSGYRRDADREQARIAGADLFMVKPVPPDAVLFDVRRALILQRTGRRLVSAWKAEAKVRQELSIERRHAS